MRPATVPMTLALVVTLGGCAAPLVGGVGTAVEMESLSSTKKSLIDHAVSSARGEDCSIVQLEREGYYCKENIVVDRSNLYCTRTLGEVECHNSPDPYRNGDTALASPPPNRVVRRDQGWADVADQKAREAAR